MTLLEVLIAIFVIMFGLLGVAAMLPVGRYLMAEIDKLERSNICGTAAMQEVTLRDMARPTIAQDTGRWVYRDDANLNQLFPGAPWPVLSPPRGVFPPGTTLPDGTVLTDNATEAIDRAVFLDPVGYAQPGNTAWLFPYTAQVPLNTPPGPLDRWFPGTASESPAALPRVTYRVPSTMGLILMPLALAEQIFTWRDDLSIVIPSDVRDRPRQSYLANRYDNSNSYLGRAGWAFPWSTGDPPIQPGDRLDGLYSQYDGNYSWAVMLVPSAIPPNVLAQSQGPFTAYVIVYYRRDLNPATAERPLERAVCANMVGGGVGGGDVTLTTTVDPTYLDVRPNQWLLLCGIDSTERRKNELVRVFTGSPPTPQVFGNLQYQWYRVIAADRDVVPVPSTTPQRWSREVTLQGPDWPTPSTSPTGHWCAKVTPGNPTPANIDGHGNDTDGDAIAVLVDGVVHVYSSTSQ